MTKDINTVFVNLTTIQQSKVPTQYIKTTKNNKNVILISDLKLFCSSLSNELLSYQDILPSQFNVVPISSNISYDPLINEMYHIVPSAFVTQNKGFRDAANQLNAVQTIDGRWVCGFNTLYEFWDVFGGQTIQCARLQITDFPMFNRNGIRTN